MDLDKDDALEQAYIFYNGLVYDDINRIYKKIKNPERIKRLLRSYSRAISSQMPNAKIRAQYH